MRPPNMRPLSRRVPLPVTINTTRRFCADESAMNALTARSAATRVMPCRSSLASGLRLPFDSERSTSRSNDCSAGDFVIPSAARDLSRTGKDPSAFGLGMTASFGLGVTGFLAGRLRPLSGFTSAIAARNSSTSLAIRLM